MSPAAWNKADSPTIEFSKQQLPVTGALWLALLKFSSGEWNVSKAEREVLLAYGLIRREQDATVLTPYGRQMLELSS
jgi:hypothetical protein